MQVGLKNSDINIITNILYNNRNGFTVSVSGKIPLKGFMVSIKRYEKKKKKINIQSIRDYIINTMHILENDNYFIGIWKYQGYYYLDVSIKINNKNAAIREAIKEKQKAIYDIIAQKEIKIERKK